MIILEDVTKTYSSGVPALNGINLHVQKGEFVFIVGKSGSGKSTLIKLLLKELDPTTGKIYVNKKEAAFFKKGYRCCFSGFPSVTGQKCI